MTKTSFLVCSNLSTVYIRCDTVKAGGVQRFKYRQSPALIQDMNLKDTSFKLSVSLQPKPSLSLP